MTRRIADYTQIVFAENIIAVIRSPSFYAASRRPVPSEGERIPILPLFHARFAGRHRGGNLVDAPGLEPGTSCMCVVERAFSWVALHIAQYAWSSCRTR